MSAFASFEEALPGILRAVHVFHAHVVPLDAVADVSLEETYRMLLLRAGGRLPPARPHLKEGGAVYDIVSGLQSGVTTRQCTDGTQEPVFRRPDTERQANNGRSGSHFENAAGGSDPPAPPARPKYGNDIDEVDDLACGS